MSLFDRYGKLRKALPAGHVHTEQKGILKLLRGRLTEKDIPAVVVEPAGEEELRETLRFAADKQLKVALSYEQIPVSAKRLAGHLLILTTRLAGAVEFRPSQGSVQVQAGVPVQALTLDLARSGKRWLPLWPEPVGATAGELIATGWEGLRNWRKGGTIAHVRNVVWMGYDGTLFSSDAGGLTSPSLDLSGFLFGSHGDYGLIMSTVLALEEIPAERNLALFQFSDNRGALEMLAELRSATPAPEAVVYWNEAATSILRRGTDGTVNPDTGVLIAAEWSGAMDWKPEWSRYGACASEEATVNNLWQDLLRYERIAARLYPENSGMRLRVPAPALPEIAAAALQLGKDSNLPVSLWGTVEGGAMRVSVLRPDAEPRTHREALEVLEDLCATAYSHGAALARGERMTFKPQSPGSGQSPLPGNIHEMLCERCDPQSIGIHPVE